MQSRMKIINGLPFRRAMGKLSTGGRAEVGEAKGIGSESVGTSTERRGATAQ